MTTYLRRLRAKVGNELLILPGTACAIVTSTNEVLLQQRKDDGQWGCPGGLLDPGESLVGCVKREMQEETGFEIEQLELIGIYSGPEYEGQYPNGDKIAGLVTAFYTRHYTGELSQNDESIQLQYFPISTLPDSLGKHHQQYLQDLQSHLLEGKLLPVVI